MIDPLTWWGSLGEKWRVLIRGRYLADSLDGIYMLELTQTAQPKIGPYSQCIV
jgi:hypothetical protein